MANEHHYSKNFYLINFLQTPPSPNLMYFSNWPANLKKVNIIPLIYGKVNNMHKPFKIVF